MKLWKKMTALMMAMLILFAFAACTQDQEQTTGDTTEAAQTTEAETTVQTTAAEETTADTSAYAPYAGTWYANGYCVVLTEEGDWTCVDAQEEMVSNGYLRTYPEGGLALYDPEGSLSAVVVESEQDTLQMETYTDVLSDLSSAILTKSADDGAAIDTTQDAVIAPSESNDEVCAGDLETGE